jgi:soluble lytic murein transglycosylase
LHLADFLQNCSDIALRVQGLRMASRALMNDPAADAPLTRDSLRLVYPRFFNAEITAVSDEFELSPAYLFALTRSESFFDPEISSHAGARGLTQLMDSTAADIARKLSMSDYSLFDAETNLRFGAFYFAELRGRLDGNVLAAFFAYNAGISRVRTWLTSARGLPPDLFLETIPFAETREYGKNVVSAACMYAWLYDGVPVNETLDAIMP